VACLPSGGQGASKDTAATVSTAVGTRTSSFSFDGAFRGPGSPDHAGGLP
jgi:hypothetical protein